MTRHAPASAVTISALLAGAALLGGCGEKPVRSYTIAKEKPAAGQPGADMAGASLPGMSAPAAPGATWTAPASWKEKSANSVRVGSYEVAGADGATADFAITVFPGDVGGDLANVNRWRSQIGLPPIAEGELAAALRPHAAPAGEFRTVNFVNTAPPAQRVLAALFKQADRTWFFKLAGPDALVAAEETNFRALLDSVKFAAGEATVAGAPRSTDAKLPDGHPPIGGATLPDGHPPLGGATLPDGHPPLGGGPAATMPADAAMPANHPPIGAMPALPGAAGAVPAAAAKNSLAWAAPDHWVAKPLGAMRRGSFTVKNAAGEADLSIIVLGAAGNPLPDNVNRWRGQVGLAPLAGAALDAAVAKVAANGLEFAVVDLPGTQPGAGTPARILGAIAYRGDEAWFVKLSGADAVVAAEKAAFLEFLHTVRPAAN